MKNINIILEALKTEGRSNFNSLFKPTLSALSGESYGPRIVDLISDANYDILETTELIYDTLIENYLKTKSMHQLLHKIDIAYDCMFKMIHNIPFEQELTLDQTLSGYLDIYGHLHTYLVNNSSLDLNQIEDSFLENLNILISVSPKFSWTLVSKEDTLKCVQFVNTLISKLNTQQIINWLPTFSQNQILSNIVQQLNIYTQIPRLELEFYRTLGLSDTECCATYIAQEQYKTVKAHPLVQFDFE